MNSISSFVIFAAICIGCGLILLFTDFNIGIIDKGALIFTLFFTGGVLLFIVVNSHFRMKKDLEKLKEKAKRKPTKRELEEREKWAGKLKVETDALIFEHGEELKVKVKISDIKVIGEFTTEADPVATDWYLIIVKNDNEVIYLPAYAVGLQESLTELSKILNYEIVPKLFASVKFDSNVIYPESIDGNKLFHLKGLNPNGIWEKIKVRMGLSPITPILRSEIIELKK